MKPKEQLLRDFDALVDNYHASRQETRAMLNQYAIGRWVPVEERLPNKAWEGLVIMDDEQAIAEFEPPEPGIEHCWRAYDQGIYDDSITHWLELDMPEVES